MSLECLLNGLEDPGAAAAVEIRRLGDVAAINVTRVDDAGSERIADVYVVVADGLEGPGPKLRMQKFQPFHAV